MFSLSTETGYLHNLQGLAAFIKQPYYLPLALRQFLFLIDNPNCTSAPNSFSELPQFHGHIHVHHSALAMFFVPSDLCGVGGMCQERIRSMPSWYDHPHHDTVFVILDDTLPGMKGMVIACVHLFLSFNYKRVDYSCAFVNWLVCNSNDPDPDTGMWIVSLEEQGGKPTAQVIDVKTIACTAHLLPVFGPDSVPIDIQYYNSLDRYQSFFVNSFVDHHSHESLTDRY